MMLPHISARNKTAEIMDSPDCHKAQLTKVLRDLARMNNASASGLLLTRKIIHLWSSRPKYIRILDLGSGGGDVLCSITRRLQQSGFKVDAIGTDMNQNSVELANQYATQTRSSIKFYRAEALEAVSEFKYDLVISSLFLHHLTEGQVMTLFSKVKDRADVGMVMSDLLRSRFSYNLVWFATLLLSRSKIVRQDGLASVRGAFTAPELQALALEAKLMGCKVGKLCPFRQVLTWVRGDFDTSRNQSSVDCMTINGATE